MGKVNGWALGGLLLAGGTLVFNLFKGKHDEKIAEEKNNKKLEELFNNYVTNKERTDN